MRIRTVFIGLLALSTGAALAETERRELGPHVHGAGSLSIAIEGNKVSMDFSAPANDILGFEHQPSTPEQTKVLEAAKALLGQPLKLIEMPAEAACVVVSANVVFNAADPGAAKAATPGAEEHQHADFDVDYVVTCAAPAKITALSFPYFKLFSGAQKLTVTVASEAGQSQFDVTRESPSRTLK